MLPWATSWGCDVARMIPDLPSPKTQSDAEKVIFARLKEELSDDWVAFHSLGLATHARKPWAEIDFVLVGPLGIYCLEVKGGEVRRERGRWAFINRHGKTNWKQEGPFDQVGSASPALFNWLKKNGPGSIDLLIGHGVVVPDTEFKVRGPDILPEVVYDGADVASDIRLDEYVRRLSGYWRQRLGRAPSELTARQVSIITDLLRGDFVTVASPGLVARGINRQLIELTEEQGRVMEALSANERVWTRGGAGTGKTLLAIEEVERLSRNGARVLYTCFNKRLAVSVGQRLSEDGVTCLHLHGLMADVLGDRLGQRPDIDDDHYFGVWMPEQALDLVLHGGIEYDAIVVDEGQDLLLPAYVDLLDALLSGGLDDGTWRWFSDPAQNLFGATSGEATTHLRNANPAMCQLSVNCRNTRAIANIAHLLSGVRMVETAQVDGPEVDLLWYRDESHAIRQVSRWIAKLISGGIPVDEVVVLGRRHLASGLLAGGLLAEVPYPLVEGARSGEGVEYSTIRSFKGLEADAVVLLDVDGFSAREVLADLYAGGTRPRTHLAVAISEEYREGFTEMSRRFGETLAAVTAEVN